MPTTLDDIDALPLYTVAIENRAAPISDEKRLACPDWLFEGIDRRSQLPVVCWAILGWWN